jgi:Glycosyltransferase sugar-binding region containing DXD motif
MTMSGRCRLRVVLLGFVVVAFLALWKSLYNLSGLLNSSSRYPGGVFDAGEPSVVDTKPTDLLTGDDTKTKEPTTTTAQGIPHRLVFTYKWNLLERKEPKRFYDNVMRTIRAYEAVWGKHDCTVVFLDDDACRRVIQTTAPELLPYFEKEPKGSYRADICRVVELYANGGYYFDVDMELINEPFVVDSKDTTFGSVIEPWGLFFQSFLFSEAGNPILKLSFEKIRLYLDNPYPRRLFFHLGPSTLKAAYDELKGANATLLQEVNLKNHPASYLPQVPRRKGKGCCCNYVVLYNGVPYFYSRIVGAGSNCDFP